ncbi:MAG: hypothetical protein H6559_01695 [Lewinellaceae bacterium]|nr:hypothetical protein [Lewinellaceae bacterium]
MYFNQQVRQGISSFSALAHAAEVKKGLSRLENDLKSGEIDDVAARYQHDKEDYLFIIGARNTY